MLTYAGAGRAQEDERKAAAAAVLQRVNEVRSLLLVQKYLLYWYKRTCFTGAKVVGKRL